MLEKIKYFLPLVLLHIMFLADAQNTGKIHGKVTDSTGIPLDLVEVMLKENTTIGTITNEAGRYELNVEANKNLTVIFNSLGYEQVEIPIYVEKGKRKQISVILKQSSIVLDDFLVKERYNLNDELEKIDPKIINVMPTLNNSIENLIKMGGIGVIANDDLSSQYNVRGGSYDENLIYLNGFEIYRPFLIRSGQQEGLSFINPDLVESVNFSSGGFNAEYGDKMSSVLDVKYKIPKKFGASISGSLTGASGHIEGISKNKQFTYLLGARYQSNAYFIKQLQKKGYYNPNFIDVQLLLNYISKNKKWNFSLFGNYARNTYTLIPTTQESSFGTVEEVKKLTIYFDGQEVDAYQTIFGSFVATYDVNENNRLSFNIAYFNSVEKETFDIEAAYFLSEVDVDLGSDSVGKNISSRAVGGDLHHGRNFLRANIFHAEIKGNHTLKKKNTLEWGLKAQGEFIYDNLCEWRMKDSSYYSLPHVPTTPGDSTPFNHAAREFTVSDYLKAVNDLQTMRISGFVQDKWNFGNENHSFQLSGGVRFSYWTFNDEFILTPRMRLSYLPKITNASGKTAEVSFHIAAGMYYQSPFYKEMRRADGTLNTDIKSQKSYHFILETNYLFKIARRPFKLTGEVYYKHLRDLISYNLDNVRVLYSGENDALGYAAGLDVKLSGEIVKDLESWLMFSIMKSMENIDYTFDGKELQTGYIARPTDQRFSINLFFQDKVPRLPMLKAHINIIFSTPLTYRIALDTEKLYKFKKGKEYFRADIGLSWQFINSATSFKPKNPLRFIKGGYLSFEIFNLFDYANVISYTHIKDIDNNSYYVPNYLMPRIYNAKLRFEF